MERFDNKRIAILVFLFIFGGVLLGKAVYGIINGDAEYEEAITSSTLDPVDISDTKEEFLTDSNIYYSRVIFKTHDVFSANNPINYTISAATNDPDKYDKIIVIALSSQTDLSMVTTDTIISAAEKSISFENITLSRIPNDNVFVGSKNNVIVPSEGKLGFLLIPYKNGQYQGALFILKDQPLIINPATAEFQAQTNRDIQRQIIESGRINERVEALTLILIGLMVVGFSAETVLHRFFVHY